MATVTVGLVPLLAHKATNIFNKNKKPKELCKI
jgi:hypothetical protein